MYFLEKGLVSWNIGGECGTIFLLYLIFFSYIYQHLCKCSLHKYQIFDTKHMYVTLLSFDKFLFFVTIKFYRHRNLEISANSKDDKKRDTHSRLLDLKMRLCETHYT